MSARLLAWALALALAAARMPVLAAGLPEYGTKNFMPAPETPSYFTGERGLPYAGPQETAPAAPAVIAPEPSAAAPAASSPMQADLSPHPTRLAHHYSRYQRRAARTRALHWVRSHGLHASRLTRSYRLRLAHARPQHKSSFVR